MTAPGFLDAVAADILQRLPSEATRFVFPSETAAEFWMERVLEVSARRAVEKERFLSWDAFKSGFLSPHHALRPVSSEHRLLFVHDLANRNAEEPFLRALVRPEHAAVSSGASAPDFLLLLPALARLLPRVEAAKNPAKAELLADLRLVDARYRGMLAERGLFDPDLEEKRSVRPEGESRIYFPDLLLDYSEWRDFLSGVRGVSFFRLDEAAKGGGPRFALYDTLHDELRAVFGRVADLLRSGVDAAELVLTVAELRDIRPLLEREAAKRGIPLSIRAGKPLSDYAAGRIWSLGRAALDGFAFEDVQRFYADPSVPWRERKRWLDLLALGLELHCTRSSARPPGGEDEWERKLKASGNAREAGTHRALRERLRSLAGAASFEALGAAANELVNAFWDKGLLPPGEQRVFEACLDALKELEAAAADWGEGLNYRPFDVWLAALGKRIYVPKTPPGVRVYDYRVAAGIPAKHHFLVNFSQEATRTEEKGVPWFGPALARSFGFEAEPLTRAYQLAYSVSGDRVHAGGSTETWGGRRLVPELYSENYERARAPDGPYRAEEAWWSGQPEGNAAADRTLLNEAFHPTGAQAASYGAALRSSLASRGLDLSAAAAPDDLKPVLRSRVTKEASGYVALSPSSLKAYADCPFNYFLTRVLKLKETQYGFTAEDFFLKGNVIHGVLHDFFEDYLNAKRSVNSADKETHVVRLKAALTAYFARARREGLDWTAPAWEGLRRWIAVRIPRIVDAELNAWDGAKVIGVELGLNRVWNEGEVCLNGRIDRISALDDEAVLVDYKTGNAPPKTSVLNAGPSSSDGDVGDQFSDGDQSADGLEPGEASGSDYQLAFYTFLMDMIRLENPTLPAVTRGAYFSVRDAKFVGVFSPDGSQCWVDAEAWEDVLARTADVVRAAAAGIRAGDFRAPDQCASCAFRGACRTRFRIRD